MAPSASATNVVVFATYLGASTRIVCAAPLRAKLVEKGEATAGASSICTFACAGETLTTSLAVVLGAAVVAALLRAVT